ncbi:MAG: energy transducer TonB [Blastocatellia bacterium]|nr:energy transducer TonB [Blastocatellia bacterium]
MSLIHGYIYKTETTTQRQDRFFKRHLLKFCAVSSVLFHFALFGWIFYKGVIAPLTSMSITDEAYNEVKWIEITKTTQPLKYPRTMLPYSTKTVPLDQLELEREKQERREKEQKEAEKRRNKEKEKQDQDQAEDVSEENTEAKAEEKTEEEKPAGSPRFGEINAKPIKDIVGKVYTIYRGGGLDLKEAIFSIKLGFEVDSDGSVDNITIIESSGSAQIDTAALNIAAAIGASHALLPLASLSRTTAALNLSATEASLVISGFASTEAGANDLAINFSQQLAGLKLLMSFRNKEAYTLLSNLVVSNESNQLLATLKMSRAEASSMMQKNFSTTPPAEEQKEESKDSSMLLR